MENSAWVALLVICLSLCCPEPSLSFSPSPFRQQYLQGQDPWWTITMIRSTNYRHPMPMTLYGKLRKSTSSSSSKSPMDSLMKMVVPGKRTSSVESGIEAALLLTDKRRQEEWKKDTRQKFPLVPSFVVDACIDSLSDAFSSVAPAELKAVLRPGGLEEARPRLEATLVSNLENHQVMKGIPLKADDKRQFLQYLVNMSMGYVLRDAELLLAEPSVKLQALEVQKQEIQKYMTFWQFTWYRIRYHPLQTSLLTIGSVYIGYSLYQQSKHTAFVSAITGVFASVFTQIQILTRKLFKILGLGSTKSTMRRRTVRRVVRK